MNPHNADYRVAIFGAGGQSVKFLFLVNLPTVTPKQLQYILFLGVGKTSIISRFMNGTFQEAYVATTEDTYK